MRPRYFPPEPSDEEVPRAHRVTHGWRLSLPGVRHWERIWMLKWILTLELNHVTCNLDKRTQIIIAPALPCQPADEYYRTVVLAVSAAELVLSWRQAMKTDALLSFAGLVAGKINVTNKICVYAILTKREQDRWISTKLLLLLLMLLRFYRPRRGRAR